MDVEPVFVPWPHIKNFQNLCVRRSKQQMHDTRNSNVCMLRCADNDVVFDSPRFDQKNNQDFDLTASNSCTINLNNVKQINNVIDNQTTLETSHVSCIRYRPKIKFHGSNAGILMENNQFLVQSRNIFIKDRVNFGSFAHKHCEYFSSLKLHHVKKMVIFGEYCGPRVQKGVALSLLPHDIFAVFAIWIDNQLVIEPDEIILIMTKQNTIHMPERVHVLPWYMDSLDIDFDVTKTYQNDIITKIDDEINRIDQSDPWVKQTFDIDGIGEGLVFYPLTNVKTINISILSDNLIFNTIDVKYFTDNAFKCKGKHHQEIKSNSSMRMPTVDPKNKLNTLVNIICPAHRMEKVYDECTEKYGDDDDNHNVVSIATFMRTLSENIQRECTFVLEAHDVKWNMIKKPLNNVAVDWYRHHVSK